MRVMVRDQAGKSQEWTVVLGNTKEMTEAGFNLLSFAPGNEYVIAGHPYRDPAEHRLLATTTFVAVVILWLAGRRASLPRPARLALHALIAAAALQFALGVATLLLVVPVALGAAHQAGAVVLMTAAIAFRHALRRRPELDATRAASI